MPASGRPDPAGPSFAVGQGAQRDQRFGAAVALHRRVAGEPDQFVEHRHRQRGAARHQQSRRRQRQGGVQVTDDPRPHRRHPEVQRTVRLRVRRRASVFRCARSDFRPAASRAARAPGRARGTAAGRAPGCRRASTATPARARRCRRRSARRLISTPLGGPVVPEVYMTIAVASGGRLGVAVPRPRVQPHGDVRQSLGLVGQLPEPRLRTGVGEDVTAFGDADVGGHRDDGDARDQAAGDGQHRRRGRRGQHGHPLRAARRVRPPTSRRRPGRCGSASLRRCARRRRCRVRRRRPRGSSEASSTTATVPADVARSILDAWIPSSASRPARCTGTRG